MKILLISGLSALFLLAHTFANAQCQADYNGDGNITAADLGSFLGDYSLGQNCVQCDLNNDGNVNQQDVTLFQGYFGANCATIPPLCQADYNSDGVVTAADLTAFLGDLSLGTNCVQCDLNGDGNVGPADELVFQGVFGTSCSVGCQGDYNNDGVITAADLTSFLVDYGLGQNCVQCDMNNNGVVDQTDVTTFQGLFGASCATIPTDCPADYNGDGIITSADLTPFLADYALGPNCVQCDLNGDGNVNQGDVTLFQGLFGTSCNNPTPPTCVGDYNGDGIINSADLTLFLVDYALGPNCTQCDINGDGMINNNDVSAFKAIFGTNCPQPNTCPDYNNDGIINASDLSLFLADYALGQNCVMCDINGDGVVSSMDADFFVTLFGTKCGGKTKNLDINETETTEVGLALYPNPTSDGVNIMLDNGTAINSQNTLYVMDVSGRVIEQLDYNLSNGIIRLNVQNFESGTYFISLMTSEQHYQSKLIVK